MDSPCTMYPDCVNYRWTIPGNDSLTETLYVTVQCKPFARLDHYIAMDMDF